MRFLVESGVKKFTETFLDKPAHIEIETPINNVNKLTLIGDMIRIIPVAHMAFAAAMIGVRSVQAFKIKRQISVIDREIQKLSDPESIGALKKKREKREEEGVGLILEICKNLSSLAPIDGILFSIKSLRKDWKTYRFNQRYTPF